MVQNLITTVPTGTHHSPRETTVPRDYGGTQYIYNKDSSRCVMVSQPLQDVATLSTTDNTFHTDGIGLSRNRKLYSLSKFGQSDSYNGNRIKRP